MTTLRDSWLSTGATQAEVYRKIRELFKKRAIHRSTFMEALKPLTRVHAEERTVMQITRAFAEIRREG